MSARAWVVVLLIVAAIGWWYSPVSPRHSPRGYERVDIPATVSSAHASTAPAKAGCPLPPRVSPFDKPLQSDVPGALAAFQLRAATLKPLAGFSIDARVLSRQDYRSGREAELSPVDLALGWGRMRDDDVLGRLTITQSGRWYHYRYSGEPPIPQNEIDRSAANMHMIPADDAIASALRDIEAGQRVRIDGWLVEAEAPDGWHWRSSTTRDDTGGGACEVVYVCAVTRL